MDAAINRFQYHPRLEMAWLYDRNGSITFPVGKKLSDIRKVKQIKLPKLINTRGALAKNARWHQLTATRVTFAFEGVIIW